MCKQGNMHQGTMSINCDTNSIVRWIEIGKRLPYIFVATSQEKMKLPVLNLKSSWNDNSEQA